MFSQFIKFFRILSSETSPMQISMGIALAMIMGLTPLLNLHNLLVLFVLLIFRINLATFLLAWAFFSGMAYLLDPTFHTVGREILSNKDMLGQWTEMYNSTFWRVSHFNNTIVMGSLAISLAAFVPVVIISNILVRYYRSHLYIYLQNSKIVRFVQQSKLFTRIVSMVE
jgi:uncharacterized protein (TIGR03546 family)